MCDEPRRFGRVAAANSLSDVWAMGGEPLFALNLCCFPAFGVPDGVFAEILLGAADALAEAGAALLGGHSVADPELKFGLAVVGRVAPDEVWDNRNARPGERLILTKPLGTGVLVNAFKADAIDAGGLEPALTEMERLNAEACRAGRARGVRCATDVTGFGLAGHALNVARGSGVTLRLRFDDLPVHDGFYDLVARGVTTGCTDANRESAAPSLDDRRGLGDAEATLLVDPQTSGGLLLCVPAAEADALLAELAESGHRAAEVGEVVEGAGRLEIV